MLCKYAHMYKIVLRSFNATTDEYESDSGEGAHKGYSYKGYKWCIDRRAA